MSDTIISAPGIPPIQASNRHNISAICRIPGRGTAFLISPGLLMTSTKVIKTKNDASRLRAIFFEGGKRERVEAQLKPEQFFFAASFPEHLDYCIVACDTKKIFNVQPVKLPLVQSEWLPVREGDAVLTVQHPLVRRDTGIGAAAAFAKIDSNPEQANADDSASDAMDQTVQLIRHDEVLRRRDDLYFLKPNGTHFTAGCPVFIQEGGTFVGLQSQYHDMLTGDVTTSRFVSAVSIVKHLFANGRLGWIQQHPLFEDVWATWYVNGDTSRIVGVLTNFPQRSVYKQAAFKLFEHAAEKEHAESVVSCGGTKVMVECINRHEDDPDFVGAGLRALWTISFDVADNRQEIMDAGGIDMMLKTLNRFPGVEEVVQFAVVILYNLTLSHNTVTSDWAVTGLKAVHQAMATLPDVEVIQKFGIGFFANIAQVGIAFGQEILESGMLEWSMQMFSRYQKNEYLSEHAIRLVATLSQTSQFNGAPALSCCVAPVIEAMKRFHASNPIRVQGNHALWGLGNDPRNRVAIFVHPDGPTVLQSSITVVSAERPIE